MDSCEVNLSMVPWDDLPEDLKESNRRQAGYMTVRLEKVGCAITPIGGLEEELFEFSADEVELMAEIKHERWIEERLADGWSYAPGEKDTERKTSPYLILWNALSEEIKEYDRETVRAMPAFLKEAGFQIYRQKMEIAVTIRPKVHVRK